MVLRYSVVYAVLAFLSFAFDLSSSFKKTESQAIAVLDMGMAPKLLAGVS